MFAVESQTTCPKEKASNYKQSIKIHIGSNLFQPR